MRMEMYNDVREFNRVTRTYEYRRYPAGAVTVPEAVMARIRDYAALYRLSYAETAALALSYYFGDGKDHLRCEHCDLYRDGCTVPDVGGQTTLPLLDMGSVVVGLSMSDQGV